MIEKIREKIRQHGLDVREFYYLLGVLFGDGFFTKFDTNGKPHEMRLNTTDKLFANEFERYIRALGGRYTRRIYSQSEKALGRKPIHRVVVYSIRDIHTYELYENIYVPLKGNPIMLIDLLDEQNKIIPFIKGYYESEGCFYIGGKKSIKWQIQFTSSDETLLIAVRELLRRLGFEFYLSKPYYTSKISNKPFWHLRMSGRIKSIDKALRFFKTIRPVIKNMNDVFERKRK